jgi:hypothetical protein
MLTLEQISDRLRDRRPGVVAEATGLHVNTVMNVRDKPNRRFAYHVIKALSDYFEKEVEK